MGGLTGSDSDGIVRVGFVGTGGVAARHATVLSGFDGVELVAALDLDPARCQAFARAHGATAFSDVGAVLAAGVDAVYVCVPPSAHGSIEEQLAAAGVALFVEKPLAADDATAEHIHRRLRTAGVPVRVGLHWRCAEPVRRARALLEGRRIRVVSGWWLDKVPPVPWWPHLARSGGPIVEQAVHVLDLARLLVGEVAQVHAVAAGAVPGGDVPAATAALLSFREGPVGTFTATNALGWKDGTGLQIVTDDLIVGVGEDWLEVRDAGGTRRTDFDPWQGRVAADRAFIDAVRVDGQTDRSTGGPGAPDGADAVADPAPGPPDYAEALRSHRLACALARATATGKPQQIR